MEGDRRSHKQERPQLNPVSLHFSEDLRRAIKKGNPSETRTALEQMEPNYYTEALSNHLVVRSFLTEQKRSLIFLCEDLAEAETIAEAVRCANDYSDRLNYCFEDTFVSEDGKPELDMLTGDTLFRTILGTDDASGPLIARYIAKTDADSLHSPGEILDAMDFTRHSIINDLWKAIDDLEATGAKSRSREAALKRTIGVVEEQIKKIDDCLVGNLKPVGQE